MITLSIILAIVLTAAFFIIRNALKRNEQLDDILTNYETFITKQSEAINSMDQRLKELDTKGMFYADDEIGFFFKEIQKLQESLNEFTLK